jgi:hypothetical protein
MFPVVSSQISHVGHDAAHNVLAIQFPGKSGAAGSLYHYKNITPQIYKELTEAKSVGSYFIQNIKKHPDRHPHTRIS